MPRSTLKRTISNKCLYDRRIKYKPLAEYSMYGTAPQAISICCQLLDIALYCIIFCSCKEIENRHTKTLIYKTLSDPKGHQSPLLLIDLNKRKKATFPDFSSYKYSTHVVGCICTRSFYLILVCGRHLPILFLVTLKARLTHSNHG